MSKERNEVTRYGFNFGAAEVTRATSFKNGAVVIGVKTPKKDIKLYITKSGLISLDGERIK